MDRQERAEQFRALTNDKAYSIGDNVYYAGFSVRIVALTSDKVQVEFQDGHKEWAWKHKIEK